MVSKTILRMALALALASSLWAGSEVPWNGVVAPSDGVMNDGWETITIPLNDMLVRQPGSPLDAFDTTIVLTDWETGQAGWVSADMTAGVPDYWHVDAVPTGDANAPAWWVGDPAMADNAIAPGGYESHWQQYLYAPVLNLSAATAPITLAFKAMWAVEAPGGEPLPYNMWDGWNVQVSTDGGTTWTVLPSGDVSPAYTGNCSYAWGDHCYTGCYAAWGGSSAGYQLMSLNLSSYVGQASVQFRIAYLSDPGYDSSDDPNLFGVIVDSIRVTDASSTLLSNDGSADPGWVAAGFPLVPLGNTWVYDNTGPTGMTAIVDQSWSWNAQHLGIAQQQVTLTSPAFLLPDTAPAGHPTAYQRLKLSYYVWCDLPDSDGDNDGSLDDLYDIYVSNNGGATWTRLAYDYAYDNSETHADAGNSLLGWVRRSRGLTTGGTQTDINLTPYGEQTVQIQFRMTTDCNDDGGIGSGLHLDYVGIDATRAYPEDAAARNIQVPFPTTIGLARTWSLEWWNEGSTALNNTNLRYREWTKRPNGTFLTSNVLNTKGPYTLTTGQFQVLSDTLTPDAVGCWTIHAKTVLAGEDFPANDSTATPTNVPINGDQNLAIDVMPAGVYELGHHLRAYSVVLSNPRLVRYNAGQVGVPAADADTVDVTQFQCMYNYDSDILTLPGQTATTRINFYGQGPDNRTPGALLYTYETEIDTTETINFTQTRQWFTVNLASVYALKRLQGDIWVEVMGLDTVAGSGLPGLIAKVTDPSDTTDTRNYTRRLDIPGNPILASPSRFMMELTVVPSAVADPVTKLTVIRAFGTNNVTLNWPVSLRATSYNVYRSTDINNPLQSLLGNVVTNSYTDVGAVGADKYFYVVEALPHP